MRKAIIIFVLTAVSTFAAEKKISDAEFLSPEKAISVMDIPDGFEIKVFVSEPDIIETIAFCFDHRGRLWTLENGNYTQRKDHYVKENKNRIQIFEDTDGDGIFDKKKLFIDGLKFSSGIAVGFGGVYVGSPPNLIFIPDADGDDRPDGKAEILLDGWGINDRHETLNSFNWGPDGWLYGCHGVFTSSWVGKPGASKRDRDFIDGGIWRWHPIRKVFEIFARGLSNPWGFDFNDVGDGFATCCVIPHLFHVVQGGVYDKQSKPNYNVYAYENIKTIRDHTHKSAHGGARFYLGNAFPKKYRDQLFMCNIHQHEVLTDIMEPKGSGYVGRHGENFLQANDKAWVGFSIEVGPAGELYILDWHDQDICGTSVRFPNSSRVYRITPKGHKSPKVGDLNRLGDEELVNLQMDDNEWYVRHARTILQERAWQGKLNIKRTGPALLKKFENAADTGKRLRALWALHATTTSKREHTKIMTKALSHQDQHVRAWAVQLLCESVPSKKVVNELENLAKKESSSVVRRYLASALQRLPHADRWGILTVLSGYEQDVNDHNIPKMLWLALEPMVKSDEERALRLALNSKMPKLQEFSARRMLSSFVARHSFEEAPLLTIVEKIAPGFKLTGQNNAEKAKLLESFRNEMVLQTKPRNRNTPAVLYRQMAVPKNKKTFLKFRVSHQPHSWWNMTVKINEEIIYETRVADNTTESGWLEADIDLTSYQGENISVKLMNAGTGKGPKYGIWSKVQINHE